MILREAGSGAERLLKDRRVEPLRERGSGRPAGRAVVAGADEEAARKSASAATASGSAPALRTTRPGAAGSRSSSAGALQSSIGTITSAGPR